MDHATDARSVAFNVDWKEYTEDVVERAGARHLTVELEEIMTL